MRQHNITARRLSYSIYLVSTIGGLIQKRSDCFLLCKPQTFPKLFMYVYEYTFEKENIELDFDVSIQICALPYYTL